MELFEEANRRQQLQWEMGNKRTHETDTVYFLVRCICFLAFKLKGNLCDRGYIYLPVNIVNRQSAYDVIISTFWAGEGKTFRFRLFHLNAQMQSQWF